jgi:hypothetical protein
MNEMRFEALTGALSKLRPDKLHFHCTGDTYPKDVKWIGEGQAPSVDIINKEIEVQLKILEANKHQRPRMIQYNRTVPTQDLIVALWEKVVEGRDESANELQKKRLKIKKDIPKAKE